MKTGQAGVCCWRALTEPEAEPELLATPKALRTALEHEKTPELSAKLVVERPLERDAWAAEIDKLKFRNWYSNWH